MTDGREQVVQPGGVRETLRMVVYGRDEDGLVLATEVVAAETWSDALLDGPPVDADVRVVLLASGRGPDHLPPWLAVELVPPTAGESGPASGLYARQIADRDVEVAQRLGLRLIRARRTT